jgi:hypothetical protein
MGNFFSRIKNSLIYRYRYRYFRVTLVFWQFLSKSLISNKRELGNRKSLYVWVPVWGDKHIEWFFKFTFPSLLQSDNLPLVSKNKKIKICFYTKDNDYSIIDQRMKRHSSNYEYSITTDSNFKDKARDMMSNYLIHVFSECINNEALWLCAMPDSIYSNGSVYNMVTLSDGKGVSIAVPPARVSFESVSKSNPELLIDFNNLTNIILEHPHQSLLSANEDEDTNSTLQGISTREVLSGLALVHNLPAIFLGSPTKDDLSFFKRRPSFNIIDKVWPDMLYRQSRYKVVTSSDIATIVELTHDNDKQIKLSSNLRFNDFYPGYPSFMNHSNSIVGLWRKK